MFPEGRQVWYEGKRPKAFVAEMKAKYGFDPSTHPGWGKRHRSKKLGSWTSYPFHLPANVIDEVYPNYPLGS